MRNKGGVGMKNLYLLFLLVLFPVTAQAATITVGPGQAYTKISSGLSAMKSGDTLLIKNGTYNETINSVPSGSAGAYTVIKAENDGGVVLTASNAFSFSSNYIQIEGLKVVGPSEKGIDGHHVKILRCAFSGGPSSGNTVNFAFCGSYNLLEDCWFYGLGGRYKILIWRSHHNVMRRCVIRQDAGWNVYQSDPEAGVAVYESSNISLQNVIVIDSDLKYTNNYVGAFYVTGHQGNPSSDNVEMLGCISLNNEGVHLSNDTDDGGVGFNATDFIAYGRGELGIATSNTSMNMTFNRATMGNSTSRIIGVWGDKTVSFSNSILWNASSSHTGSASATYTDAYSPNDFSGTGVIHINPQANGLLYLPRIENGSVLKTSGSASGQMGAQVVKRYGASGTLHGEAGYNSLTNVDLWPWPYEDRIKADMAAVSARGFATGTSRSGSPQTLTKYIWEYLGSTIPDEIYAGTPQVYLQAPEIKNIIVK